MDNPHAFWDNRYAAGEYVYGTRPNRYFETQLPTMDRPGRILMLAEGEGRNAVFAAQKGWNVTAVDFSREGRRKALELAASRSVSIDYQIADLGQFDFRNDTPWDAIGLFYAHLPPPLRIKIHQQCVAALQPGGLLMLEAFRPQQLQRTTGGPKDPDMLYTLEQLLNDFKGLEVVEALEGAAYLEEGAGHEGLGEIVRLTLKKP